MYKPEIDGIRALSIISVIACHLNFTWARNGFLGVDIFFVISGYLIVGGIVNSIEQSYEKRKVRFKFSNFYFRRVRRIIPVALTVQIFVLIYSYLFTNSLVIKSTFQDFKWSSFFLANFHFAEKNTDYFQSGFSPSPLLHTWSLSIEEQFYVFFPIIFLLLLKFLVNCFALLSWRTSLHSQILLILFSLSLMSFLFNLHTMNIDPIRGYYSSLARFWEITLGGIIYTLSKYFDSILIKNKIKIFLPILIVIVILLLWKTDHVSVLKQIIAVIPVSIYLLFMSKFSKISWFLKLDVLTYIGKISYSAYLWHWPVFIWVRDYNLSRFAEIYVSVTITLILSVATWKFVETPFRRIPVPKRWA
jgi:peptidoglycan/LPS O-acetylase OafA/YrhL